MNAEVETATSKKKLVSLPFLLVAIVLVVGGYPVGKWVMQKVMTVQEQKKAAAKPTLSDIGLEAAENGLPSTAPDQDANVGESNREQ